MTELLERFIKLSHSLRDNYIEEVERPHSKYTQMDSKVGMMPRRRPAFESGEAGAEAAKLEKFGDAGGFKGRSCPTPAATNF